MKFLTKSGLKIATGYALLISCMNIQAAGYQILGGMNYENPAALGFVQTVEAEFGDTILRTKTDFTGRTGPYTGSALSNQTDNLFHGKFAYRLLPKVVVGLNVTQPVISDIFYPINSFLKYNSTGTYLRVTDISPRLAYQVNEKLNVGVGFDASGGYAAQLSFIVPVTRLTPYGQLLNTTHGWSWAYGYDLGLTYRLAEGTILSGSYYSKISNYSGHGVSTWGPITTTNVSNNIAIPALWSASIVQYLNKQWLVSATLNYAVWSARSPYFVLKHTAIGQINIPYFFKNALTTQLKTKYAFNESWAGVIGAMYNPAIQPAQYESVGLPLYAYWEIGGGPEYTFKKNWTVKATYAYGWGSLHMNNHGTIGPVIGDSTIRLNVFNIALAYKGDAPVVASK